jgi:ABC-type sugar transport system ATPase subunit
MEEILVQMEGIDKYFPGVHALDKCRFELLKGEVHALVGENGAGKSTLMNELVHEGKSIIMISSELPELLRMSDRIAVMCEGVLTGSVNIEDATQEKIIKLATLRRER